MTDDKFILMSLDDERSKDIAEVLGNKTCRKIIEHLAGVKGASEKDISDALSIPINTIEYNLNKLIKTGLIEKTKNFFWSIKGKKIEMYRLSNKKIIISPRSFVKGIAPAFAAIILGAFGIKLLGDKLNYNLVNQASDFSRATSNAPQAIEKVSSVSENIPADYFQNICSVISTESWVWFLLGGLVAILIFLLLSQFKKMKGGF